MPPLIVYRLNSNTMKGTNSASMALASTVAAVATLRPLGSGRIE